MIIEIMGRPGPHVRDALEKHVQNLDSSKAVEVHSIKISDPKEIERDEENKNADPMYTCFAEVDFEVETFNILSGIVFDFMPSSIEVTEPHSFNLDANEITELLNNIGGRLHRYDEVAKMAQGKIGYLENQLNQFDGKNISSKAKGQDSEASNDSEDEKKSSKKDKKAARKSKKKEDKK